KQGECRMIAASAESFLQPTLSPEMLATHMITLERDGTVDLTDLTGWLIACGYVRSDSVSGPGQFSLRGDILDVFPVQMQSPVRAEFWDDTIDTLTHFDPDTQRRTDPIDT